MKTSKLSTMRFKHLIAFNCILLCVLVLWMSTWLQTNWMNHVNELINSTFYITICCSYNEC